jgi:hypothetical protein
VYKVKFKAGGTVERHKVRLVAKGNTQCEGLDYYETFSSVAKLTIVRCLLALVAAHNWHLHQLDVNNAFLNGDLHEEVYMSLPPGFASKGENRVCKLVKSLYGLKQASRQWFAKFSSTLISHGSVQSRADYSLFTQLQGSVFVAILVYVDDIIIASNDLAFVSPLTTFLDTQFKLKDLGPLKFFLGLEIARTSKGLSICQRSMPWTYLRMLVCLMSNQLISPWTSISCCLAPQGSPWLIPHRQLVGRLHYLTITRPDISYSVQILSQFVDSPRQPHFDVALQVLRYIKSAPAQSLFFPATSTPHLKAFCDSNWAGCPNTRKYVTSFCIFWGIL